MFNYALINEKTHEVLDISVWDEKTQWQPPKGILAIKCPDWVHSGCTYDAKSHVFTDEHWHRHCNWLNPEHDARDGQIVSAGQIVRHKPKEN